jgi:hypothetical protein
VGLLSGKKAKLSPHGGLVLGHHFNIDLSPRVSAAGAEWLAKIQTIDKHLTILVRPSFIFSRAASLMLLRDACLVEIPRLAIATAILH